MTQQQYESKVTPIKYRWIKSVLQMAEDGYTVEKFVYREGDYTVWYTLEPKSYTVYYQDYMAGKEE